MGYGNMYICKCGGDVASDLWLKIVILQEPTQVEEFKNIVTNVGQAQRTEQNVQGVFERGLRFL